jgi:hypothetical protein
MLARHTWPSDHVSGSASSMLQLPMVGWLPTSTTSWPSLVATLTPTSSCT